MRPCKVSVVMTARNEARAVGRAISSILAQTLNDLELIVVDDGSADGTRAEIDKFCDPRLRVLSNKPGMGISRSRNRAITQAAGMYIAIFDADDVSAPDRLEKQARFLDENPGVALCGSWGLRRAGGRAEVFKQPLTHHEISASLDRTNPVINSTLMARSGVLKEYRYDESLGRHEDYDLILRCAKKETLANLPETLVEFEASDSVAYAVREHYWKTVVRLRAVFRYGYPPKMLLWILPSLVIPFIPYRVKIWLKKLFV